MKKNTWIVVLALFVGALVSITDVSAQSYYRRYKAAYEPSFTLLGGANMFVGEAYPKNIVSAGGGILFQKPVSSLFGYRVKYEAGQLKGTDSNISMGELYSAEVIYNMISVGANFYLDNYLLEEDLYRNFGIYLHASAGVIVGDYKHIDLIMDVNNLYKTSQNDPATSFQFNGGLGLTYKLNANFALVSEFTGVMIPGETIDGIVGQRTRTSPKVDGYDAFFSGQLGIRYTFGSGGYNYRGSRRNWRSLPSFRNATRRR